MSSIQVNIEYIVSAAGHNSNSRQLPGSQCIDDPFPSICIEFNVTVSAMNNIGISYSTANFTSSACQGNVSILQFCILLRYAFPILALVQIHL